MNILFVCSRNKWRSRTAESIFKNNGLHQVKSAGTAPTARVRVSESLIKWADLIFVMEDQHHAFLQQQFKAAVREKQIIVLGIEDIYPYMDPELIEILQISVPPFLGGE